MWVGKFSRNIYNQLCAILITVIDLLTQVSSSVLVLERLPFTEAAAATYRHEDFILKSSATKTSTILLHTFYELSTILLQTYYKLFTRLLQPLQSEQNTQPS